MKHKSGISNVIIILAMLVIFLVLIYFCLDMFEVIHVPEQYSLVDMLSSKIYITQKGETEEAKPIPIPSEEESDKKPNIKRIETNKPSNELTGEYDYPQNNTNTETPQEQAVEQPVEQEQPQEEQVEPAPAQGEPTSYATPVINSNNTFYYEQLDVYGKLIYDELYRHIEDLKTGTYVVNFGTTFNSLLHEEDGVSILENAFQLSVNSLVFDKPEIFYLDITKMYLFTEITTFGVKKTYRISIGPVEGTSYLALPFKNEAEVNSAKAQMDAIIDSVAYEHQGESDYEIIRAIHDYIVENTDYDSSLNHINIYSMYGTYINQLAVCEGYSKAFKYAMDRLNIPCIIACGIGVNQTGNTESHAWNYVRLNNLWYGIDVTWDDPIIIGYGNATRKMRYHYFLVGSNELFQDHHEDGNLVGDFKFTYPEISPSNF